MKNSVVYFCFVAISVYIIILFVTKDNSPKTYDIELYDKYVILNENAKMDVEQFLPFAVMSVMPIDSEEELLKMQLVITRTYLLNKMQEKQEISIEELELEYTTYDELEEKWGTQFVRNYNKLQKLVYNTNKEVITYEEKLILPFFHSMSAGYTRDGEALFGDEYEYLKSVESEYDIAANNYLKIQYFDKTEFIKRLKEYDNEIDINEENIFDKFTVKKVCEAGYVILVQADNSVIDGEEFARLYDVPSECFQVEEYNSGIRIISKGIGSGFGVSINGAASMAKEGKSYKEILEYYYKNISVG